LIEHTNRYHPTLCQLKMLQQLLTLKTIQNVNTIMVNPLSTPILTLIERANRYHHTLCQLKMLQQLLTLKTIHKRYLYSLSLKVFIHTLIPLVTCKRVVVIIQHTQIFNEKIHDI
ncbi:hypothetical protein O97_00072, partial [Bartonella henselae str. Zeus]